MRVVPANTCLLLRPSAATYHGLIPAFAGTGIERLAARAALHHAVIVVVIFEEHRILRAALQLLHTVVFVPDDAAIEAAIGGVPPGLVAVQVVEEDLRADLRRRMRLARPIAVKAVMNLLHVSPYGRKGALLNFEWIIQKFDGQGSRRGCFLAGAAPERRSVAAVLTAIKNKPSVAAEEAAILDSSSARQRGACAGRDGGMASIEQRNVNW
jgi:hypothetical protein